MESWDQQILVRFSQDPKDFWTVDDAMKGTSIIGSTGSGKTSGSGRMIALKFLEQGWGGLVLCAKKDEARLWKEYAEKAGRTNDLIIFGKNSIHEEKGHEHEGKTIVFNPLHYEMTRSGEGAGEAFNLTNIFMNLNKVRSRASNEGESRKDDQFWDNALKRIISRTIELITLAGEELTFRNIIDAIYNAPTQSKPLNSGLLGSFRQHVKYEDDSKAREQLKTNFFLKCFAKIMNKVAIKQVEEESYNALDNYFTSSLPNMSEHTHNAIIESFMGVTEPFLSGILKTHFSGKTTLYPEEIYTKNKIIVLNFPVKEFLDAGIMAQSIFKLLFQQSIERRDTKEYAQPVFLWGDEIQYFLTQYDQLFLTTARSSRTATVYLSQSISNYYAAIGGGTEAKPKVDSLMGNLTTKIFHANSDAVTNEYASRLIGNDISYLDAKNVSSKLYSTDINTTESITASYLPQVQPTKFTTLKSGGANNSFEVEGYVFATGKMWSNEKNYKKVIFTQNFDQSK